MYVYEFTDSRVKSTPKWIKDNTAPIEYFFLQNIISVWMSKHQQFLNEDNAFHCHNFPD